jgi:hypothetical protein
MTMKKLSWTTLVFAAGLLLNHTAAFAAPFKVTLDSTASVCEIGLAEGWARLNLERGVVQIRVGELPRNPITHDLLPVTLTECTPLPSMDQVAVGYEGWLLRVETSDGRFVVVDGMPLGALKVGAKFGHLNFNGHQDLSVHGFNTIAVMAETHPGARSWVPGNELWQAFRWSQSPNRVIMLWSMFAPME